MPLQKIVFKPGISRENTNYAGEGGYYDGDKIRFRSGYPEKIGGWEPITPTQFLGICRAMWNWVTNTGENYLGVGTNLKYYVEAGGVYNDITPLRKTVDPMLGLQPPATGDPFYTAFSTLDGGIDATQTTLTLTSGTSFPITGIIKIDSEQISYSSKTGDVLSGLTRGINGTTADVHLTGVDVGCATITVEDNSNGAITNDFVTFSGATGPVGGIPAASINKEQQIVFQLDAESYIFNATDAAGSYVFSTSAASGGGAAAIAEYQVNTGLDVFVQGVGWGAATWGSGPWGIGTQLSVGTQLLLWTNDNYGEDLVIAQRGGPIAYWNATGGFGPRAIELGALSTTNGYAGQFVPNATNEIIASSIQRFVVALGANPYDPSDANTPFDPMLVRWSDQENPFEWQPAVTNQSGEFRLSHGSFIMAGLPSRQENLIWTDSALYTMKYLGPPYVWGFDVLAENISVMSPHSMVVANNVAYWMGVDKFYAYNGRVETLPCAVRQFVFADLNRDQAYQVFAGQNEGYNEIWWFYCSGTSTTLDKYVIYNYLDNAWYYGNMARTAWLDSGTRPYPMAATYSNKVVYHEVGTDDVETGTALPIHAYVQTSDFDIGDGHNFGFMWRMLPDVNFNGSNVDKPTVTMQVKPRRNAGARYGASDNPAVESQDNYSTTRQYTIQEFDGQVYTRLRGRQMAFKIESTDLGVAWQLGAVRVDLRPDGRRGS
jgi:hypothetical protein